MTDYIAYLESQRKMLEQFEARAAGIAADTATESAEIRRQVARNPVRHGLAEALLAAASRLDPAVA